MKKIYALLIIIVCVIFLVGLGISWGSDSSTRRGLLGVDCIMVYSADGTIMPKPLSDYAKHTDLPTNNTQLVNGSNFITRAGVTLTTTGTTGPATYNSATGVINVPNYTTTLTAPAYNNTPSRPLVTTTTAAGYQVSATKNARVRYSIDLSALITVGGANVFFEISPNNTTWSTVEKCGETSISLLNTKSYNIGGEIPAGWYARIRGAATGGGTIAIPFGQEIIYN